MHLIITTSLFRHGVHLDTVLEMCSRVHLWLQDNNINFGQEISSKESQNTKECRKHVCSHGERASADEVEGEEADPGHHVHHEAKGHALGLVVVGRQVFAHVTEGEAKDAEQRYVNQFNCCTG